MSRLYDTIEKLCKDNGINVTKLCRDTSIPRGNLSDLKMGRSQKLSVTTISKIADYFHVSTDYLLGKEQVAPDKMETSPRPVTDDDIKFALFGGEKGISDEAYEDVKRFAAFIKEKYKKD